MQTKQLWNQILHRLKEEYDITTYSTWFTSLEPVNEDERTIYLVTNDFNAGIINSGNNHYTQDFKRIHLELTGTDKNFIVLSDKDLGNSFKKQEESRKKNSVTSCNLNPNYIFEDFVVGNKNQFAHAACVAVSNNPGKSYNPLFLYGGVGLGKTHLMHAIGNYIKKQREDANIIYVSSETFTNDFIGSILQQKTENFRSKYRSADVLLIDDIQFLSTKEQTQEAFFHTFNELQLSNKQIVISSDRHPKEIKTLEDRLRSRFSMGLTIDIGPPDFETRVAILQKKGEKEEKRIPLEVYEYIANNIKSNIRELEGALTRVVAYSSLVGRDIDLATCVEALKEVIDQTQENVIDYQFIRKIICEHFGINEQDLDSSKRTKKLTYPRQIAMYLIRDYTDLSLPRIGEIFGNRDHSTVVYAYDKIMTEVNEDPKTRDIVEQLRQKIAR